METASHGSDVIVKKSNSIEAMSLGILQDTRHPPPYTFSSIVSAVVMNRGGGGGGGDVGGCGGRS